MGKIKSFKLTPKHRRFVQQFVKTGNASESGRAVGFTAQYGRELMQEPTIVCAIQEATLKAGLTDELLTRKHIDLITCGERNVELGALRLGYQVKKKIGSDDAPPPAVLPAVVIKIGGKIGASTVRATGGAATEQRGVRADGPARVSLRRPNKS